MIITIQPKNYYKHTILHRPLSASKPIDLKNHWSSEIGSSKGLFIPEKIFKNKKYEMQDEELKKEENNGREFNGKDVLLETMTPLTLHCFTTKQNFYHWILPECKRRRGNLLNQFKKTMKFKWKINWCEQWKWVFVSRNYYSYFVWLSSNNDFDILNSWVKNKGEKNQEMLSYDVISWQVWKLLWLSEKISFINLSNLVRLFTSLSYKVKKCVFSTFWNICMFTWKKN